MQNLNSLDDVLDHVNRPGRFTSRLTIITCVFSALCPITWWLQVFLDMEPEDYFCDIPDFGNYTLIQRKHFLIPHLETPAQSEVHYDKCHMYDVAPEALQDFPGSHDYPQTTCKTGHYFNLTGFYHSTVTEFAWVCGEHWRSSLPQTVFYIGSILGVCICGYISDVSGRLYSIVGCCLLQGLTLLGLGLTHKYPLHLLFRFIWGLCTPYGSIVMILAFEYVGPQVRTRLNVLGSLLGYIPAAALLPYVTLYINEWRTLCCVMAMPFFLVALLPYFIPESPRWELQMGRKTSVLQTMETIAATNRKPLSKGEISAIQNCLEAIVSHKQRKDSPHFLRKFQNKNFRTRMSLLCLSWFMLSICYDGNVRNVSNLKSDPLFSWSFFYVAEYPGVLLTHYATDTLGRRWTVGGSILMAGVFVSLCGLLSPGWLLFQTCAVLSRILATVAINVMFQFRTELIPTSLRSQGNSFVEVVGISGSLLTPYLIYTTDIWYDFPFVILAIFSVLGAMATLKLPETLNKQLPDDLSEFTEETNDC